MGEILADNKDIRKKVFYILGNVILFGIIFYYIKEFTLGLNDEILIQNFEIGLIGVSVFSICWILDFRQLKGGKVLDIINQIAWTGST